MPELGDLAGEHRLGVEVGEGGGRRRVGQVVGGHVDGLHRRDGAVVGRGDPLLEGAHLRRQRRLVAHGRGHTAEEGGHLGARLAEPEDVVHEHEDVTAALVAEVLGHGQARQGDPQAGAGRLVHLAVAEDGLVDDARLLHLEPEVVALTGPLAHAAEHGVAAVLLGDVVDQLHDDDGLAHAGAAEQAGLAALGVGGEQVDDLDAGLEDLGVGGQPLELRRRGVDRPALLDVHRAAVVDRLAEEVEDPPEALLADRHRDRGAGVRDLGAPHDAVGRRHRHGPDLVPPDVLLHLGHEMDAVVALALVDDQGGVDLRQRRPRTRTRRRGRAR